MPRAPVLGGVHQPRVDDGCKAGHPTNVQGRFADGGGQHDALRGQPPEPLWVLRRAASKLAPRRPDIHRHVEVAPAVGGQAFVHKQQVHGLAVHVEPAGRQRALQGVRGGHPLCGAARSDERRNVVSVAQHFQLRRRVGAVGVRRHDVGRVLPKRAGALHLPQAKHEQVRRQLHVALTWQEHQDVARRASCLLRQENLRAPSRAAAWGSV